MSKKIRDEFTQRTITALRRRVCNTCSNPDCCIQTVEPQLTDEEKFTDTGVAAHICAAAPKGPRYDAEMSTLKRKHISNAIWLCSVCSIKIDREPDAYSVELLKKWKVDAELRIKNNLNKKLFTEDETNYRLIKTVAQTAGFNMPEKLLYSLNGITEIFNKNFREFDPRLDIKYSYINGHNHFEINRAKVEVDNPVLIGITPKNISEFEQKIKELSHHGTGISFDITAFRSNSDSLNQILPSSIKEGKIKINPFNKIKATVEIQDSDENVLLCFDDLILIGTSTFSFSSQIFGGLVKLNIDKVKFSGESFEKETTMMLDYKIWDNQDLLNLSYFDKIYKFYNKIINAEEFYIKININGLECFSAKNEIKKEEFANLITLLSYIYNCRILCEILNYKVAFRSGFKLTKDDYQQIVDEIRALEIIKLSDSFNISRTVILEKFVSLDLIAGVEDFETKKEHIVNIKNMFNKSICQKVIVLEHFSKVKIIAEYKNIDQQHTYKINFNNTDKKGTYARITKLTKEFSDIDTKK